MKTEMKYKKLWVTASISHSRIAVIKTKNCWEDRGWGGGRRTGSHSNRFRQKGEGDLQIHWEGARAVRYQESEERAPHDPKIHGTLDYYRTTCFSVQEKRLARSESLTFLKLNSYLTSAVGTDELSTRNLVTTDSTEPCFLLTHLINNVTSLRY